jgi:type IV pilus assembly protein PilM
MIGLSQVLRKETVVGVDFGSRLMKVCYAEPNGPDRWRVTRTSFAATPRDSIRDGIIVDRVSAANALKELIRSANLTHVTGANAAIAGASVIVRHVKLPRMQESVLRRSIPYEAAKHISTSIDDSTIEFEIIGPVAGEPDKMNVMLVAAPNEMINSRIETLEMAGLEPVAIDVEAFATQHALLELGSTTTEEDSTIALLDIGANSTDVTIITNGYFALTRNISLAGDHFTNAIKNAKLCSFDEAEQLKHSVDMNSLLSPDGNPEDQVMAKMVQPTLDELLREVRRSINYYQSQVAEGSLMLPVDAKSVGVSDDLEASTARRSGAGGQVAKLVITGGSALLKGLHGYMEVRLGATVENWNIFENPAIECTQLAPSFIDAHHSLFALSTGLAVKQPKKASLVIAGGIGSKLQFNAKAAKKAA